MPFFIHVIYLPIYNLLAFFADVVPNGDLGLAVIAVTLAVRLILLPPSLSAARTQKAMKDLQPHLDALKEKHKDDPQEHARATFALYKERKVKPFSSMLIMFVQLPILIGVFAVTKDVIHYAIDPGLLYPFIAPPAHVSALFLGTFSVAAPSLTLAIIAGLVQFAYASRVMAVPPKTEGAASAKDDFARAMALQMRYVFPFLMAFFAYASGAVALYLAAGSLFLIAQDLIVRRLHPDAPSPAPAA